MAGAYHSRLMAAAQEKFGVALGEVEVGTPQIPVICNFSAEGVNDPEHIRETLTKQVTG